MKTQAHSISEIINGINLKEDIKTIIFVGGYCYNEILVNLIKNNLKKITTFLQPSNPSLAIMEGAVMFGIEPSIINIRKAKYTIGEKKRKPWDDKIHSDKGEKYFNEDFKKWFCKHCFDKYIEVNQNIKHGAKISHKGYFNLDQKSATLSFYKTKKQNPIFAFDEGLVKIGECRLYLDTAYKDLSDRVIETTMKFGGTFIDVTAIHTKSGKSVKTTLTFD